ncbi:MAG: RtcB family protein, partial [Planctomycetales bacterium]
MSKGYSGPLERVNDCCWRIPKSYKQGMRVDGLIYANDELIKLIKDDRAPEQVANVAFLPGIQHASLAMPDIHWGYGFCIGGVCATDPEEDGVISPGGVGYDINCGVRLMRSNLSLQDVKPHLKTLMDVLFAQIPAGVGKSGKYHFKKSELLQLMAEGPRWLRSRGLATNADIDYTEARGKLEGARPECVSDKAISRGEKQCGTLGAGNHF